MTMDLDALKANIKLLFLATKSPNQSSYDYTVRFQDFCNCLYTPLILLFRKEMIG